VEALNAKAIEINTGDVAGTVNVSNFPEIQAVSLSSIPLPAGAATDAMVTAIRDMEDTLVTQLQAMISKMPRVSKVGQIEVMGGDNGGTGAFTTQLSEYTNNHVSSVRRDLGTAAMFYRTHEPVQFANMGALHLYNGITIS
jgi:hypothetical protein